MHALVQKALTNEYRRVQLLFYILIQNFLNLRVSRSRCVLGTLILFYRFSNILYFTTSISNVILAHIFET